MRRLAMFGAIGALMATVAPAAAAPPTTEQRTITGAQPEGFSTLRFGPGWARVVRGDLQPPLRGRSRRRGSLAYFSQLSDFQLADEESPGRVEILDRDGTPFTAAWRPQEAFGPHTIDQAIRQVNAFGRSPHRQARRRRAPLGFAITTGDNGDNQQFNETLWVLQLLEGGRLDPNSGVESDAPCPFGPVPEGEAARYTGVQDVDDLPSSGFYDPDEPRGRYAGWPRWPGLMDRAQRPFETPGLDVPSYLSIGNHDGLVQGNQAANAQFQDVVVGCVKPPAVEVAGLDLGELAQGQRFAVPPDPKRAFVTKAEYREINASGRQDDDHGFAYVDPEEARASDGAASYYAFTPRPGLRFISIDTVSEGGIAGPSANGNLDDPQFRWIEREIVAAERRDELVVLFGHHPIRTLDSPIVDEQAGRCSGAEREGVTEENPGCDRDPRDSAPIHDGEDLQQLLLAHRHVVAFVAGHTHEHSITPFRREDGSGGFWGIETSSEVDWPIQSRLLEVMDNADGTLSILGTVIDHGAPLDVPAPGSDASRFSDTQLASIGRVLSFNDPQAGGRPGAVGEPGDRNVELLVPDPRRDVQVRIASRRVRVDRGSRARLSVTCTGAAGRLCGGVVTARGPASRRGGTGARLARSRTVLGRAGRRARYTLRLGRRARTVLRREGRLRARLTVRAPDGTTTVRRVVLVRRR